MYFSPLQIRVQPSGLLDPAVEPLVSTDIPHLPPPPASEPRKPEAVDVVGGSSKPEGDPLHLLKKVSKLLDEPELSPSAVVNVNPKVDLVFVLFGCLLRVLMTMQLGSLFFGVSILKNEPLNCISFGIF